MLLNVALSGGSFEPNFKDEFNPGKEGKSGILLPLLTCNVDAPGKCSFLLGFIIRMPVASSMRDILDCFDIST